MLGDNDRDPCTYGYGGSGSLLPGEQKRAFLIYCKNRLCCQETAQGTGSGTQCPPRLPLAPTSVVPQGPAGRLDLRGWPSRSWAPEHLPLPTLAGAEDSMSQAPGAQPNPPSVYHERQRLELCAVHALNNVLQQQLFSQEAADEICKR